MNLWARNASKVPTLADRVEALALFRLQPASSLACLIAVGFLVAAALWGRLGKRSYRLAYCVGRVFEHWCTSQPLRLPAVHSLVLPHLAGGYGDDDMSHRSVMTVFQNVLFRGFQARCRRCVSLARLIYRGLNNYLYYFGGSLYSIMGPQTPFYFLRPLHYRTLL